MYMYILTFHCNGVNYGTLHAVASTMRTQSCKEITSLLIAIALNVELWGLTLLSRGQAAVWVWNNTSDYGSEQNYRGGGLLRLRWEVPGHPTFCCTSPQRKLKPQYSPEAI